MSSASEASEPQVRLIVDDDGQYQLQGKALDLAELDAALRALKVAQPNVGLHVVGSPKAAYEQVAPAVRLARQHGLAKSGVVAGDHPSHDPDP